MYRAQGRFIQAQLTPQRILQCEKLLSCHSTLCVFASESRAAERCAPDSSCSVVGPLSQLKMYSFMGGGLFCAIVGNILLVVCTATDYWMQYRLSGNYAHQGLWRYCMANKCYMQTDSIAYWNATRAFMILSGMTCFAGIIAGIMNHVFVSTFFVLVGMAIYTGVTVNFLGRRFGDWRFSWSYILGWVAMLMTFFAGIFYICAYRMCECRRGNGPR
ncbi:hypothetical protein WMY93_019971 [Mugilogobius chulae]|uniref:Uncharacterized protein n=1 Tax=Mugilogobius chulae TaxID=88201 RepID=A0AAW0NIP1_9GOBI